MRRTHRVLVLTVAPLLVLQLAMWLAHGQDSLLAASFERDLALSEEAASSESFPTGADGPRYLVLCRELAQELEQFQIEAAEARLVAIYEKLGVSPSRLVTEASWVAKQSVQVDQEAAEMAAREANGWCANSRINTPLVGIVDCYDGVGDISWHGHSHMFLYVPGFWLPVWHGGEWVT